MTGFDAGQFTAKLCGLFGAVGVGSIVAWAAALVLLGAGALLGDGLRRAQPSRARLYRAALILALAGYVLSRVNSAKVNTYREDPKEAEARLAEERRKQAGAEQPEERDGAARVRFAEDARGDRYDLAGVEDGDEGYEGYADEAEAREGGGKGEAADATGERTGNGGASADGEGSAGAEEDEGHVPLYRRRGKRERDAGRKRSEGAVAGAGEDEEGSEGGFGGERERVDPGSDLLAPAATGGAGAEVVYLPERDVYLANRVDAVNLKAAWATLLLAVALATFGYLRGFNDTAGRAYPLPLAALPPPVPGIVDRLSPKAHSTCLAGAREGYPERSLERAVRRGETFVYLGDSDPWDGDGLPRLPFGLWPLRKLTCEDEDDPDAEFIFESTWFGRYCFVVEGKEPAGKLLDALVGFLSLRQSTRARALRTVNVAWDHEELPPLEHIDRLAFLCRETNFRLIVASRDGSAAEGGLPEEFTSLFDEVVLSGGGVRRKAGNA